MRLLEIVVLYRPGYIVQILIQPPIRQILDKILALLLIMIMHDMSIFW